MIESPRRYRGDSHSEEGHNPDRVDVYQQLGCQFQTWVEAAIWTHGDDYL